MKVRVGAVTICAALALGALGMTPSGAAVDVSDFRLPERFLFGTSHGAIVHLAPVVTHTSARDALRGVGAAIRVDAPAANAVAIGGDAATLARVAGLPFVTRLEAIREMELASETAGWATGARATHEPTGGRDLRLRDAGGAPVDGSGVGIAIVDTGIDATHPDLRWAGFGESNPKVLRNFHLAGAIAYSGDSGLPPNQYVDAPHTDTMGHGTHVAGIAAGSGAGSGGRYRGVAPGAKIYGFAPGRGYPFLGSDVLAALQWIYDHGHEQDPPIRVINGSFGGGGAYNPEDAASVLVEALIRDRGVTMVWAAMNAGGNGSTDNTNFSGKSPTPGVLMVANYDDEGAASTRGPLNVSSSRGLASDPATWPDLAAPGSAITAPCTPGEWMCPLGPNTSQPHHYATASGTSMAAPHVTGVVALLYQAKPAISPAEVEHLLEATARKISFGAPYQPDPRHPGRTSSFDKGHGLLDAYAAVEQLVGPGEGGDAGSTTVLATDGEDSHVPGAFDIRALAIEETPDGTIALRMTLRDLDDLPPLTTGQYRTTLVTGGRRVTLTYALNGTGVTAAGDVPALDVGRNGDVIVARYAPAALGAQPGGVVIDAVATAAGGAGTDTAPTGSGTLSVTDVVGGEEHVFLGS